MAKYDEGKTQIQSPGGNKIMVYSMERTLCDILRKRGGLDKGIVAEAFKPKFDELVSSFFLHNYHFPIF